MIVQFSVEAYERPVMTWAEIYACQCGDWWLTVFYTFKFFLFTPPLIPVGIYYTA